MQNKFLLILFFIFVLCFCFFPSASADPAVLVYSYSLSPEVFMPGDTGVLSVVIKNSETTGTYAISNTVGTVTYTTTDTLGATLNSIYITSATDGFKQYVRGILNYEDLGYLGPTNTLNLDFEIVVDENISEGLYFPKVRIDLEETTYEDSYYPVKVKVSNESVDLIRSSVPSRISVSGSTDITLTAVNNREASVNAVTISSSDGNGIDFVEDSIFIGDMDAYSSEDVTFSIIPSETGVNNLSFDLSFKNGDNLHTNSLDFQIEVVETLDVAPVLYSIPSSIEKGSTSKVRIEVYNAKSDSISGVLVTPVTNVSISPSQYFIGSMDADDVFSASFDISTDDLEINNEYEIDFKVSFKQGNNYYETPSVSSSFKVVEPTENGSIDLSIVLLTFFVVLIILVYLLHKFKKRRTAK